MDHIRYIRGPENQILDKRIDGFGADEMEQRAEALDA